jgi:hypothetical protein
MTPPPALASAAHAAGSGQVSAALMPAVLVLLLALGVGIVVGVKSKKLTGIELGVCGLFGLLIGATEPGGWLVVKIAAAVSALGPTVAGWFS